MSRAVPLGMHVMEATMPAGKRHHVQVLAVSQRGFTLLFALAAAFLLALATQGVMWVASQQAQREREAELLRIGQAMIQAIGRFYEGTPGSVKRWPRTLDELTDDRRMVTQARYLREIYADPMTRSREWGLIESPDGGIAGVYSQSIETPIRSGSVELSDLNLPAATRYADWRFVYKPATSAVSTSSLAPLPVKEH